jgi:hypothetical protein
VFDGVYSLKHSFHLGSDLSSVSSFLRMSLNGTLKQATRT